jgi:hypothetical protein
VEHVPVLPRKFSNLSLKLGKNCGIVPIEEKSTEEQMAGLTHKLSPPQTLRLQQPERLFITVAKTGKMLQDLDMRRIPATLA